MKLLSFIDEGRTWTPVEVELELWPGLPEIHFLGRPDQHLRESAKRIKSAIKAQGFDFPVAQQILVNLKPSYIKKSSRGLELAVAAAYLMETGQVEKWADLPRPYFYGELSLTGEVSAPEGLSRTLLPLEAQLVTGQTEEEIPFGFHQVTSLQTLSSAQWTPGRKPRTRWEPNADVLDLEVSEELGNFLGPISLGAHSVLFAGAGGAGKTTAARILHALLPEPEEQSAFEILQRTTGAFPEQHWRPFIQPHHSIPMASLMGGGSEAHGGELARADHGLLLLDEFFEFTPLVMEALREPLEQKKMRVSRGARVHEYPVRAQVVATTNLCPCGDYVPGQHRTTSCRFTLTKCRSYSGKISGPLLDRFEVLHLMKAGGGSAARKVSVRDLRAKLRDLRARLREKGRSPGSDPLASLQSRTHPFYLKHDWATRPGSERRRIATLRVAQSLCDWRGEEQIKGDHLNEALTWTVTHFEKLKRWDLG